MLLGAGHTLSLELRAGDAGVKTDDVTFPM